MMDNIIKIVTFSGEKEYLKDCFESLGYFDFGGDVKVNGLASAIRDVVRRDLKYAFEHNVIYPEIYTEELPKTDLSIDRYNEVFNPPQKTYLNIRVERLELLHIRKEISFTPFNYTSAQNYIHRLLKRTFNYNVNGSGFLVIPVLK